jgi:hypothetical protein
MFKTKIKITDDGFFVMDDGSRVPIGSDGLVKVQATVTWLLNGVAITKLSAPSTVLLKAGTTMSLDASLRF